MTENVKKITVTNYKGVNGTIEIEPEGKSLVVIAGANGSGKSSLIDAVTEVFDPKGTKLTPQPIHEGQDRAEVTVETDEFVLTRVWKKNDAGTLTVKTADGAKFPKGKSIVEKLVGSGLFDPSQFLMRTASEQKKELLQLVDLPFDIDEMNRREAGLVDDRRVAKSRAADLKARAEGLPDGEAGEERSAADLLGQIRAAQDAERAFVDADDEEARCRERVDAARQELANAEAAMSAAMEIAERANQNRSTVDVNDLTAQLEGVEEYNARVREWNAKADAEAAARAAAHEVERLDRAVTELRADKEKGLAAAKFPVEGLGFDMDGITFNGVPFSQLNSAQQEVVAFGLATAKDRELRLVISKHGDLLDDVSLQRLRNLATEGGFLVLLERDRNRADATVVIRDGQLDDVA